jgi:hypothetical protein
MVHRGEGAAGPGRFSPNTRCGVQGECGDDCTAEAQWQREPEWHGVVVREPLARHLRCPSSRCAEFCAATRQCVSHPNREGGPSARAATSSKAAEPPLARDRPDDGRCRSGDDSGGCSQGVAAAFDAHNASRGRLPPFTGHAKRPATVRTCSRHGPSVSPTRASPMRRSGTPRSAGSGASPLESRIGAPARRLPARRHHPLATPRTEVPLVDRA